MFNWVQFLSYAIATTITPGPNTIMAMSNASRQGFRKGFPFNLGIWVGFSSVALLSALFCSVLSALIPKIKTPMLFIGAAYMLYLAWKTLRRSSVIEEDARQGTFLSGLIFQFINPKVYIFCMVSMEAYILPYFQGQWGALIFFALLLAFIGFVFTILWSLFGSMFKLLFSKYARITNPIMALLLVYCAVSLFR